MPNGCSGSFWQDYNFQIASMPKRGLRRRACGGHICPKNYAKQYNMDCIKCNKCSSRNYTNFNDCGESCECPEKPDCSKQPCTKDLCKDGRGRREINGKCCECPEETDCIGVFCIQTACKDGRGRREINGECCKCPEEII